MQSDAIMYHFSTVYLKTFTASIFQANQLVANFVARTLQMSLSDFILESLILAYILTFLVA